jgi:hypothetical protein
MHRLSPTIAFASLLCAACGPNWADTGPEDGENPIQVRSFDYDASSLLLSEDGDQAVMVTSAGAILFDTWTGDGSASTAKGDFAQPTLECWLDQRVAIVDRGADAGVFLWEPGVTGYEQREDKEGSANASNARSFDGGLAWVGRRAENCRILRDGLATATIEACGYVRDMTIARADGTVFLGYDDDKGGLSVLKIDPSGAATSLDTPMYRVAWDNLREVLYSADEDGTRVEAVTIQGGPVFGIDLPGPVVDLAVLEPQGLLAVLTSEGSDGVIHVIDQITGEELTQLNAGSSSSALAASADGSTVATLQAGRLVVTTVDWVALRQQLSDTGS